jgi:hypothetical protein
MTRKRLMTTLMRMKQALSRGTRTLRSMACCGNARERLIAVEFEAADSAVVPVTVLG